MMQLILEVKIKSSIFRVNHFYTLISPTKSKSETGSRTARDSTERQKPESDFCVFPERCGRGAGKGLNFGGI